MTEPISLRLAPAWTIAERSNSRVKTIIWWRHEAEGCLGLRLRDFVSFALKKIGSLRRFTVTAFDASESNAEI
jgi:hypothetical protein